jgi:hypothetical protein
VTDLKYKKHGQVEMKVRLVAAPVEVAELVR